MFFVGATKYIHAIIFPSLYLEVLVKFLIQRVSKLSIFLCWMWSGYDIYSCNHLSIATSGSAREILEPRLWKQSIFRCWMWSGYDIYLCNDPSVVIPRSAREMLEPTTLNAIYLPMLNVIRLWNIFMQSSFHRYIWKYSWKIGAYEFQCNLSYDVEFDWARINMYALIHLSLYLEVLAKRFRLRVSI